jgi:hypothetical protein
MLYAPPQKPKRWSFENPHCRILEQPKSYSICHSQCSSPYGAPSPSPFSPTPLCLSPVRGGQILWWHLLLPVLPRGLLLPAFLCLAPPKPCWLLLSLSQPDLALLYSLSSGHLLPTSHASASALPPRLLWCSHQPPHLHLQRPLQLCAWQWLPLWLHHLHPSALPGWLFLPWRQPSAPAALPLPLPVPLCPAVLTSALHMEPHYPLWH